MKNNKDHTSEFEDLPANNLLAEMKHKDVFKTPENYFNTLPVEISEKIHASSHQSVYLFSFPKLAVTIAVFAAFLVTGTLYFLNTSKNEKAQVVFTYDDLINSGYAYEYDDQLLIDHYFSVQSPKSYENTSGAMNEYLIEDDIDITLIINEL